MTEEVSLDAVMSRRFELDDEITRIANQQKAALAPLVEELKLCETYIKGELTASGAQSWKSSTTGHHTYFTTKDSVTVKDMDGVIRFMLAAAPPADILPDHTLWPAILDHIATHGMWGLLNKAVNKTAAKELIEAQTPPPGVEYSAYKDLAWRRGKV